MSFDMNKMLQQVQQMQAEMEKAQEELRQETVEASAGGGMVTVKANGALEIMEIKIDPKAIDPEDPEMLGDMVLAAVNEALRAAQSLVDSRRDHALICVVEQPVDLISLERTHEFRGLYHVLGGALSPLDGVEREHLRIDEL